MTRNAMPEHYPISTQIYKELEGNILSKQYKKLAEERYNAIKALNMPFTKYYKMPIRKTGKSITFIENTIKRGKPVLIDFWATWCLPCIKLLPLVDSIEKVFPNIQVLKLSLDTDLSKWIKFSLEQNLKQNYVVMPNSKLSIVRDYFVSEIPRFVLFDKNGHCVSFNLSLTDNKDLFSLLSKIQNE
jgi:thiol-disulfide isomerase/thioredoxin